jgi:tetratricopeptide (TPR) repeat protein
MPEYFISARDPNGRKVTERFEASSADEAVEALHNVGYTEIVLHTDDVFAAVAPIRRSPASKLSPREIVKLRSGGDLSLSLFLLRRAYFSWWPPVVVAMALCHWSLTRAWGEIEWLVLGALLLPLPLTLVVLFLNRLNKYKRLLEAASWGRWQEVLRLLPTLSKKTNEHERAFREAQALAGLGRLDEALNLFAPFADNDEIPLWLYWSRKAEIYGAARLWHEVVEAREKAAALAPDNAALLIGLAGSLVRHKHDAHRARDLVDRAKNHAISDTVAPIVTLVEGLIALELGDASKARSELETALVARRRGWSATPHGRVVRDLIHAHLAIAYAQLGKMKSARKHFRHAEPRMRALASDDLLQRCEHALGATGD